MEQQYLHFKEIDSTNNYLKDNYRSFNNFTFVSADYQTAGKGRNDRTWLSEPGENLMFSFLIKDPKLLEKASIISLIAAVEIAKALEALQIKNVSIKWPNDVLIGDKKVCGILAEGQAPDYIVVGVGLNVNQTSFPSDLRRPATSLLIELNQNIDIKEFKESLFKQIRDSLETLDLKKCLEFFRKHNYLLGKRVSTTVNDDLFIGRVIGIDDNFALKVKNRDYLLYLDSGEIDVLDNGMQKVTTLDFVLGVPAGLVLIAGVIFLEITFYIPAIICLSLFAVLSLIMVAYTSYRIKRYSPKTVFLNNKRIDAVIFDMDGTLIDSTGLWHEIDKKFFAKRNMELPSDYAKHIVHLGLAQAAKFTKEQYHIEESEQEIMDEWHQMSIDMYRNDVELKEGAIEILEFFKKRNIPMAIATANDDTLYLPCIERLDIGKYFSYIADVNSIKEGKQSAKIYEYLANKMSAKKENVLVIEDMPTCIKTAHESGFITVAVYDNASKNYEQEKIENSDLYIKGLNELIDKLKSKEK